MPFFFMFLVSLCGRFAVRVSVGGVHPSLCFFVAVSLPCSLQRKLPLMLCGDFNSPTSSAVYKLLASNSDHDRLRWGVQACKSSQWLFEQSVSAIRAPCFTPYAFMPTHACGVRTRLQTPDILSGVGLPGPCSHHPHTLSLPSVPLPRPWYPTPGVYQDDPDARGLATGPLQLAVQPVPSKQAVPPPVPGIRVRHSVWCVLSPPFALVMFQPFPWSIPSLLCGGYPLPLAPAPRTCFPTPSFSPLCHRPRY